MEKPKTILITRSLQPTSKIRIWAAEHQLRLIEKSFIQTLAVTGLSIPETDWIFFSSPQGVKLYFENYPLSAKKIAALSDGTADAVLRENLSSSFIGNNSKSTREIAQDFFNKVEKNASVLFPLSDISKKNISSQNTTQKIIELVTYKTELFAEKVNEIPDIILFTSPSNVDGFLLKNTLSKQTKLLAIGDTTGDYLKKIGYSDCAVSSSTAEDTLIKAIEKLR